MNFISIRQDFVNSAGFKEIRVVIVAEDNLSSPCVAALTPVECGNLLFWEIRPVFRNFFIAHIPETVHHESFPIAFG